MFCQYCGIELDQKAKYCPKCGHPVDMQISEKDNRNMESEGENIHVQKKKGGLIPLAIVVVVAVAILYFAFGQSEKNGSAELKSFSNKTDKEAIEQQVYGKNTPEEVVVEAIQAMIDGDPERYMHIMPPDMLRFVLQISAGVSLESDDYQTILEGFIYYLEHEDIDILSTWSAIKYKSWECNITNREEWNDEEIKSAESSLEEYLEIKISDGVTVYFDLIYEDEEGKTEIKSDRLSVIKVNGKWYSL